MMVRSMIEISNELMTCTDPERRDEVIRERNLALSLRSKTRGSRGKNNGIHSENQEKFLKAIMDELTMRNGKPVQGCRLADAVFPVLPPMKSFVKETGQFQPGVLKFILGLDGVILLKPKSKGSKVIKSYDQADMNDKTSAFFVLEAKWDGKLPA